MIRAPQGSSESASKRVKLNHNVLMDGSDKICPETSREASLGSLCLDLLTRHVLPFVGENQYRFVGAVNRDFRNAYLAVFSPTTTFDQITSMEQAELCYHEIWIPHQHDELYLVMVEQGQLDILKYLYLQEGFSLSASLSAAAARNGHFDVLRWLVRIKCPVDATTFAGAADHGDLSMVQWLYDLPRPFSEKCSWNGRTCSTAALNGHMSILQWARSKGCPWDAQTCAMAARNDHKSILLWARFKGCP